MSVREPRVRVASMQRELRARSASRERAARAARAQPELTSCPDQAAPDLCRSDLFIIESRYIESDQNIQIRFYMQHRSNYMTVSPCNIGLSVFERTTDSF